MNMIDGKIQTPYYDFFILEKEMNLFSLQYHGVYYWQLVRFALLKAITVNGLRIINATKRQNVLGKIVGVFREAGRRKNCFNKLKNVDIIRIRPCVAMTGEKLDDHQYDYVDLSDKYKVVDLYALGDYSNVPSCVEYDMAMAERAVIFYKIKTRLFGENRLPGNQREVLREFLNKVNSIYNTSFSVAVLDKSVHYAVKCHIAYKKQYIDIFKQILPKIIMEYPHYDEHMFAANAAAKELGITTIEFQHGRINAHEAYWYEDKSEIGKYLPDYFFVYGQWWKEQINLPSFCKVVVVGNPYLEKQIQIYPREEKKQKNISVFSNPQNGKVLSEFVYNLQDYIVENNINILYKLHPNEREIWKEEYPLLAKMQNTTVIDSGSVYEVLSLSDVAIGVNSTVFYEALVYPGMRLYIYTVGDFEGMKALINSGFAKAIATSEEMLALLQEPNNDRVENINLDEMWERNAANRIRDSIVMIMNQNKR